MQFCDTDIEVTQGNVNGPVNVAAAPLPVTTEIEELKWALEKAVQTARVVEPEAAAFDF